MERLQIPDDYPIVIQRVYLEIFGDYELAAFFSQCYYWSDKSKLPGEAFYKSDEEWEREAHLTGKQLRRCRAVLCYAADEMAAAGPLQVIACKRTRINGRNVYVYEVNVAKMQLLVDAHRQPAKRQTLPKGNFTSREIQSCPSGKLPERQAQTRPSVGFKVDQTASSIIKETTTTADNTPTLPTNTPVLREKPMRPRTAARTQEREDFSFSEDELSRYPNAAKVQSWCTDRGLPLWEGQPDPAQLTRLNEGAALLAGQLEKLGYDLVGQLTSKLYGRSTVWDALRRTDPFHSRRLKRLTDEVYNLYDFTQSWKPRAVPEPPAAQLPAAHYIAHGMSEEERYWREREG